MSCGAADVTNCGEENQLWEQRDGARFPSGNHPEREKLTGTVGIFEESCYPQCILLGLCLFISSSNNNFNYLYFLSCAEASMSVCVSVMKMFRSTA